MIDAMIASSFKETLNQAVRKGLLGEKRRCIPRFVQESFPLGQDQGLRWAKALATAEAMEDEELSRKLLLPK